jgi:NTE family protein
MKKVGLVLSGGGARGLAHVGAIKVLVENKIPIDYIAGTSIGAFVGGIYAATKDVTILEEIALNNNWKEIFNLFFDPGLKGGFITGKKVIALIEKYAGQITFEKLKIPFTAVATDFNSGQAVEINKGNLGLAIRASVAVPLFFQPVTVNDQILFDGGLASPYPVETVRKMGAEVVIGVNLYDNYLNKFSPEKIDLIPLLRQSLKILIHNLAAKEAQKADVNISPELTKIGWLKLLNQKGSQEGIDLGVYATEKNIKKIQTLLKEKNIFKRLLEFLRMG